MSLLDVINNRISELTAATDAKYKAAGYEIPTASQRKAAEFSGQNPYEYATQLKQIETQQKEAEKAAKAAQKQAERAARQSSRRSSGSSSKSSSSTSQQTKAGGTSARSDLWGSAEEQTAQESTTTSKENKETTRAKSAAETHTVPSLADYDEIRENARQHKKAFKAKKRNEKERKELADKYISDPLTNATKEVIERTSPSHIIKTGGRIYEDEPPVYNPFPQGSMETNLYNIRNLEMSDMKGKQDLVEQYRAEAAAKGVDLDAELAKMNEYTGEDKSIEELALELDTEKHPEKYGIKATGPVTIDANNVKDYLDPNYVLSDEEEKAAQAYIDQYKKDHEGFDDLITLYEDAPYHVSRYNREMGTNYTLNDYLEASGISIDEYQEARSVRELEKKISNTGALLSGFTDKDYNISQVPDAVFYSLFPNAKADFYNSLSDAEKQATAYAELEENRKKRIRQSQQTQSPVMYGGGELSRMVLDTLYSQGALNGLTEASALANFPGGNKLLKGLIDIGIDTAAVDFPTDTIPEAIANYNSGMPIEEVIEKAGWNILLNAGINAGVEYLPDAVSLLNSKSVREATELAEKQAVEYAESLGKSVPFDLSDDAVEALIPGLKMGEDVASGIDIDALIKQQEEAAKTIEGLQQQIPAIPEATDGIKATDFGTSETPLSITPDVDSYAKQWDDYMSELDSTKPGTVEVTSPNLDNITTKTYADYVEDISKASDDELADILNQAANSLRRQAISEEQFESLMNIANTKYNSIPSVADTLADTTTGTARRGLNIVDTGHENATVGEVVSYYTDTMKETSNSFGTKYADIIEKNPGIKESYERLNKSIDDFTNAALHTEDNLDSYYKEIDNSRKQLSNRLKKIDEAAAKDPALGNSNISVLKQADRARYEIKNVIQESNPNEAMDWMPGFEGMTRSEMEDSAKDLFAEEAPRNIPNSTTSSPKPQASGSSNVPGANRLQFFGDGKANSKDWRTRGFRTNTAESMGWGDALPKEDYAYKVLHTDTQHKIAEERYKGSESVMNDLLNKDYDSFDAPDIKAGMTEIQSLIDSGDNVSANRLAKRVAYEGTNAGQVAQAFKEYNKNTSSGALTEAYMTQNERVVKPWKSRNKKAVEGNSRIASALAKMGDDTKTVTGGAVQLTHDQVKNGVIAELEKEFGSVEKYFNDSDIEFLTSMAETKSIPVWQITSEIEHKLNHGEWYPLYEDFELPKPKNQKLQNALDDLVNKKVRAEKPPKTFDQIREEVQNTLDSDFASFGGNFNDSDIDYLSNMISQGASKQEIEEALNTRLATDTWGISEETQQAVNDYFNQARQYNENSKEFVELQMEAYRRLANEIAPNATALEKFDSWRYLAMLGNPKTMLRNTVGNMTFNLVTSFSNSVAALGEAGVDKIVRGLGGDGIQRTKALLGTGDTDLIKSSWLDANNSRFRQLTGAKYEKFNDNSILGARSTFNSKPMQAYEKFVDWGINDYPAARTKYSTSLAGYLKANGYDTSIFDAEVKLDRLKNLSEQRLLTDAEQASVEQLTKDVNALEKARDYAVKQAEYATFHEDNKIANVLSEWSRASKERGTGIGSKVIEGTVPFKRTPANVLRSGLEYSPLGAIDSIRKTGKLIYENTGKRAGNLAETYLNKKGKEVTKTLAADVIDSWSKTLTGVGLVGLGAYLYDKDILKVSDKDLKYQDQLEGIQNYSIKINGHTYTIDWAAPSAIPLFLGAELAKIWPATGKDTENLYDNLDGYLAAFTRMADPIVETSMLSGVRDTLTNAATAVQNNDNMDMITSILAGTLTGYATQAIPTFSGQLARTIDNTRRSSYTDKEGAAGAIDRQLKKTMNKIPGLSFLNEPYVDTYGRQQQNSPFGNPIANFAYQALSPGYLAAVNTTAADTLSRNMYDIDQDTKMLPAFKSSVKVNGERVSPEDYTRYAKTYGQANYEIRTALANDEWFKSLTPTEQKTIVEGINNVANKVGMAEIDPNFESDDGAYTAYKEFGMEGLLDYYKETTEKNHVKNVAKEAGADKKFSVTDSVLKAYEEGITVNGQTVKGDEAVTMYTQAAMYLKENGMDNNEKNRQMYYDNQLTELQERKTVTDAASKYDLEYSAQNAEVLDSYGEEGLEAKQILAEAGYDFDKDGYTRSLYEQGGLPAIQGYVDDMNALTGAGLKASPKVYKAYQHALDNNPDMTVTQYANAVKKIDDNDNSEVTQDEMLGYINDGNYSEEEVMWMWNTFGDWKRIPVYSNGKWSAKNT